MPSNYPDPDLGARIITNAIVRSKGDKATYYGQELDNCADFSTLHYRLPFEKVRVLVLERRVRCLTGCASSIGIPCRLGRAEGDLGWRVYEGVPRRESPLSFWLWDFLGAEDYAV